MAASNYDPGPRNPYSPPCVNRSMLELIIVLLVIMWALGFFVVHVGSLIHFLLLIALVVLILRIIRGRPVVD